MDPALIWAILALALLALEMLATVFVLLFFGIAALIVALLSYLGLDNISVQLLLFALLGSCGLLFFRKKLKKSLKKGGHYYNDQSQEIILSEDIASQGEGRVNYQGSSWIAVNRSHEPLTKDSRVVIVATEGVKLIIKKKS